MENLLILIIVNQILNPTSNSLVSISSYIADINGDSVLNVFDIIYKPKNIIKEVGLDRLKI